ncbi:hypothetical protein [Halobacillus litoralis]|uniref:hypothetical protein n=1 Tax=Halobacillus litoralis TaxID=45668 RepID=UPI001CFF0F35|nr:hypothetical protein [Halobacillus litoralis]
MTEKKTRRGTVEQTNEMAQIFNKPMRYNQAFSHQREDSEDHSESDAMYHHYSDHPE